MPRLPSFGATQKLKGLPVLNECRIRDQTVRIIAGSLDFGHKGEVMTNKLQKGIEGVRLLAL